MKLLLVTVICIFTCSNLSGQGTLLVANKNENTVSIVQLSSGKEVAKITVGTGPHEVAVSPSGKLATTANYGNKQSAGNSITVLDIVKREKIKK